MPTFCSAFGCTNANNKEACRKNKVSFHKFPIEDKVLLKKWLQNVRRDKFVPNIGSRLCSEHFEEESFEYQNFTNRRLLKKNAIPTKFSFTSKNVRKRTSYSSCSRNSQARNEDETQEPIDEDTIMASADEIDTANRESPFSSTSTQTDVGFNFLIDELAVKNNTIEKLNAEIKSLKEDNFSPLHMTDDQLKNFSGFDKETFFMIYEFFNLEEDLHHLKLSPLRQFLLFMCRLRQGFTLDTLAYIFKISEPTACRIFNDITTIIYDKLPEAEIWPCRYQVNEYMPPAFTRKYPRCRIIIDCTEFEVQKPESPLEQQLTFSNYKNTNTAKALVGIAPSGGISFISQLWCGSASDKVIFNNSGLLNFLEPGDLVMADKGFLIAKELESINCSLVQPLFLKDKIQFSLEERVYNKGVSNLRVHVERAIIRIKYFKYFEGAVPYTSFHSLNQVFHIATFLTNFRPPLISMRIMELQDSEEQTSIKNMGAAGPSCEHPLRDSGPRITGNDDDSEKENEDMFL